MEKNKVLRMIGLSLGIILLGSTLVACSNDDPKEQVAEEGIRDTDGAVEDAEKPAEDTKEETGDATGVSPDESVSSEDEATEMSSQ